jgi:alpha-glucosidase
MTGAPMTDRWWQRAVFYQVYPLTFQDSNGDGVGDLPGITRRLDYLVDVLGVDAIWLVPFYPSPMVDGGYDTTDHCAVDPRLGSLADFDRLLAEAHRRRFAAPVPRRHGAPTRRRSDVGRSTRVHARSNSGR